MKITGEKTMPREIKDTQNYYEKLLRLIPSEIVAAYLVIIGIIPVNEPIWLNVAVTLILLLIIPFYLWRAQNVKNKNQIITTAIAFIIWVYSFNGGIFNSFGLYKPWIASIILVLFTLIMPILIVEKKEVKVKKNKKN